MPYFDSNEIGVVLEKPNIPILTKLSLHGLMYFMDYNLL